MQYESEDIEKNYNEAARIVTVATKLVYRKPFIRNRLGDTRVKEEKQKMILFYKMQNNLSPTSNYLSSLVPPLMLVPRPILYEMQLTYKQYVQILSILQVFSTFCCP